MAPLWACGDAEGTGEPAEPAEATCYQETCSESLEVTLTSLTGTPVLFRDLDDDGRADVVTRSADGSLRVYRGPEFEFVDEVELDPRFDLVAAADFTGDDVADFLLVWEGQLIAGVRAIERTSANGLSFWFLPDTVDAEDDSSADIPILIAPPKGIGREGATELRADLNGDGVPDLLAATRYYDADRVMAWSGVDGTELLDFAASDVGQADEYFGMSIASVGDVDGDGIADFVVGAPDWEDPDTARDAGRAYVYSGGDGTDAVLGTLLYAIDGRGGSFDEVSGAHIDGDELGWIAAVPLGDIDGDGLGDFALAAREAEDHEAEEEGRVLAYSGADGTELWTRTAATATPEEFRRPEAFAQAMVGVGDVNGDGVADFAVRADDFYRWDPNTQEPLFPNDTAKVYILSGDDGSTVFTAIGSFGRMFSGDLDGDGASEVILEHVNEGASKVPITIVWGKGS
jgi:hypothetical protein